MEFRRRLLRTLRAIQTVLEEAGVLVVGSEVPNLRHAVRSNLAILSLMEPRAGMPDPGPHRGRIAALLRRLERMKEDPA